MKCENCNLEINPAFKFAIDKNQCPGCGGSLMSAEQLASLKALKDLLATIVKDDMVNDLAGLIVENFELKQKFKTLPKAEGKSKIVILDDEQPGSLENIGEVEVDEEQDPDRAFDEEYKKRQAAQARQAIKQQAYEAALRNQYGMGDADEDFFDINESDDPKVMADKLKTEFKQSESKNKMLTGSGSFSRSG